MDPDAVLSRARCSHTCSSIVQMLVNCCSPVGAPDMKNVRQLTSMSFLGVDEQLFAHTCAMPRRSLDCTEALLCYKATFAVVLNFLDRTRFTFNQCRQWALFRVASRMSQVHPRLGQQTSVLASVTVLSSNARHLGWYEHCKSKDLDKTTACGCYKKNVRLVVSNSGCVECVPLSVPMYSGFGRSEVTHLPHP